MPEVVAAGAGEEEEIDQRARQQVPVSPHLICAKLCWQNLTVTVQDAKGKKREILQSIDGYAEPGHLLAIMGASGSGKSTLLDAVAGRLTTGAQLDGQVLVNGRKTSLAYGTSAYVTQDDEILIGTLTVYESVLYSALLRLPSSCTRYEITTRVEDVLLEMGLSEVADTYIGNWHLRGISGGQKRRVSIAMELITRPSVLFLDEPTSGLDSASAFFVMSIVRALATHNRTILSVIHQPSSEVFGLFDQLCLLSGGVQVYFGKAAEATGFFAAAGVPCPPLRNPSDHFLRAINKDFDQVRPKAARSLRRPEDSPAFGVSTVEETVEKLRATYAASQQFVKLKARVEQLARTEGPTLLALREESALSTLRQTLTLTGRSFKNMMRNVGLYWLRVAMYVALMVCIGTIYYDIGNSYNSIQARAAVLFFIVAFLTFMSIAGFPAFIEDMKVFTRERLNGYYSVGAFVLSNSLSSLPFLFLIAVLSSVIGYWLIGLQDGGDRVTYFILLLFSSLAVVESLMMAIAAIIPHFLMGIAAGAGILGMYMLVCGFFRLPSDLPGPVWKYPFYYVAFHTYAFEGFMTNEFEGLAFENRPSSLGQISGEEALQFFDLGDKNKWHDLIISASMVVIYRLIFFAIIKLKENGPSLRSKLLGKTD